MDGSETNKRNETAETSKCGVLKKNRNFSLRNNGEGKRVDRLRIMDHLAEDRRNSMVYWPVPTATE